MDYDELKDRCFIRFLDCRGYYDLAILIASTIAACIVLIKALGNYRDIRTEYRMSSDLAFGPNLKLKVRIIFITILFLLCFIVHLIFAMILFTIVNEENGIQNIKKNHLELWYQFTHIIGV